MVEGGEIPDMLGKYRGNRGQQLASGRFGVHMDLLNSADILEIKVGQGAKPGRRRTSTRLQGDR